MSHWEALGRSDEWYTPAYIFKALGETFDMDVAGPLIPCHVPTPVTLCANSLRQEWEGFVWMNPPYGGRNSLLPWLDKFFAHGCGVALVPDRTSAPWFQEAFPKSDLALFVPKIKFERPDGSLGKSPSNGSVLMAAGHTACRALRRAGASGLGILAKPIARKSA